MDAAQLGEQIHSNNRAGNAPTKQVNATRQFVQLPAHCDNSFTPAPFVTDDVSRSGHLKGLPLNAGITTTFVEKEQSFLPQSYLTELPLK